jgi:hypothetical protein
VEKRLDAYPPQALAYRDLVFNQWWTQASGKADKDGIFKTRAFYGDYTITLDVKTQKVTLSKREKLRQLSFK